MLSMTFLLLSVLSVLSVVISCYQLLSVVEALVKVARFGTMQHEW